MALCSLVPIRPIADDLSSRNRANSRGSAQQLSLCPQSMALFPCHLAGYELDARRGPMGRMAICGGRPDSIGTSSARQCLSVHETYGRSAKGSPPESFARQSPPCPPPALRRSDTARHASGRFRQSVRRGTARPFRCSLTSQKQLSVVSCQ